jgi:hypothetical protein
MSLFRDAAVVAKGESAEGQFVCIVPKSQSAGILR